MADTYHKRKVGKRTLSPVTQMMGFGYDPHLSEGALKPPVFLTSTFVFRTAQDGKDFFDYTSGPQAPARRRARRPGLLALQQSESRSARRSPGAVGRGRIRGGVRLRHGGDRDHAARLPEGRGRAAVQPAALRRHRDADREGAAELTASAASASPTGSRRRTWMRRSSRAMELGRDWPDHDRDAGQSRPTRWSIWR